MAALSDCRLQSDCNTSSLFAFGHRPGCPLLYRPGDLPQVALRTLCDFGRFIFLIDFLRSVDEGISPKMVR